MKHEATVEVQKQVLAVRADTGERLPASRGGQRSRPCEPRSAPFAGAGIRISSGTLPSRIGRIRVAAHRIVSPSGKLGRYLTQSK